MNQTQDILTSCVARAEHAFSHASNKAAARDAALYLAHTAEGEGIRKLAAAAGTHPSTVSRAVRRVEQMRDDPLFDQILTRAECAEAPGSANSGTSSPAPRRICRCTMLSRAFLYFGVSSAANPLK